MITKKVSTVSHLTTAGACIGLAFAASAATDPSPAATTGSTASPATASPAVQAAKPPASAVTGVFKKPAWLTELSLGVKEGYDDNLLLVSEANDPVTGKPGMRKQDAFFTTVSPKIGLNFAPLLPDQKLFQAITFAYTPEFVIYHTGDTVPGDSHESYNAHKVANTIKGKVDKFSFNLDNAFVYIDGAKDGPTYAGDDSVRSAYATATARERREQIQDRAKIVVQYDQEKWFARPVASLLYYDLMTNQRATAGYQNYADRYDVNGGADFGYKIEPQLAATLGYRAGHQYQQTYSLAIDPKQLSANNDYQRVLLGLEGKPWKWLNVSLQAGPDFRHYEGTTASHSMPVNDQNPLKYYGESSITADITPQDTLAFKYKQWQWVSSTGKIPYFDSSYELSYRRKVTSKLSLDVGGRLGGSDYTSAYTSSGASGTSWQRDDWMYTASVGLIYAFTPMLSANLAYAHDWGRNAQDELTVGQFAAFREFDRSIVSLGVQFKF